jgi:hypothetical protein
MLLTDASLKNLLRSGPARLAAAFEVPVVSDPAEALRVLS